MSQSPPAAVGDGSVRRGGCRVSRGRWRCTRSRLLGLFCGVSSCPPSV